MRVLILDKDIFFPEKVVLLQNKDRFTLSEELFPMFYGSAERIILDEGRVGFTPLNDLYLYGGNLNRDKKTIKKGKLWRKLSSLACPFSFLKQ